jgi:hypothetical protein
MYYAKVMELGGGMIMAAIADEDVIEKAVRDERSGVQILVPRSFYGDKLISEAEAVQLLEMADVLVLTGNNIVEKAIRLGFVHPDSVLEVKGIKHVQVFKFLEAGWEG